MSDSADTNGKGEAGEAAARWFVRLQDEAATADDWLAFEAWLSASPANVRAYERLEGIWVELSDAELAARKALADRPASVSRRRWLVGAGAIAASVAAAAVVGLSGWPEAEAQVYAAPPGESRAFVLSDGTKMTLNAATKVSVRMGRRTRRVEMAEGEAAFDVVHRPDRPFVITAGEHEIRVLGTEFNVRHLPSETSVTVRRGVVEVRPAQGADSFQATQVRAGQQLTRRDGETQVRLSTVEPDAALAWTQGRLVYRDAPMSEVAADLSRNLGVPVRVADPATARLRFSGVLNLDDRAAVMRRLEAFAPVKVAPSGKGFVVRRAP